MGILKVKGKMELKQFWPAGKSDADTAKIIVNVTGEQFMYKPDGSTAFRPTNAFKDAFIRATGKSRPRVFKRSKWITIRLQGIDAPELHYKIYGPVKTSGFTATKKAAFKRCNGREYRQYQAETSTVALARMLGRDRGVQELECEFITSHVDKPSDVCDVYGRFVGNIRVRVDGNWVDINHWLLREGYVFPSFYTSMSSAEVGAVNAEWRKGKKKALRLHSFYSARVLPFDPALQYREKGKVNAAADRGRVILPKLYRRQCVHWINVTSKVKDESFIDFIISKSPEDRWIPITSLKQYQALKTDAAKKRFSVPLVQLLHGDVFSREPEDVAFTEKDCFLYDSAGKLISRW